MDYIERDLEKTVKNYLGRPEIIAVLGPRQSGKTTLMKRVFGKLDDAVFISFEDREALEIFMEDEKSFAELYAKGKYLFIDEFQYAKEGGRKLKYIYDHYPGTKIVISGSSAPGLAIQSIKYLVGRIFVFNLYPLSFAEFLRYREPVVCGIFEGKKLALRNCLFGKGSMHGISSSVMRRLNKAYDEYLVYGGYPRVAVSKTAEEKAAVLKNIYSTYFLREIRDVLGLATDFGLSKLIKALSVQLGGLISYNSLGEVSGFSYKELLGHLSILEKTFICGRMPPFFTNKRTELVKIPKIYFYDSGLRNSVIGDFKSPEARQDIGPLNENFVFSQLAYCGHEPRFWRSKSKAEVDFVIDKGGLIAIECKTAFTGKAKGLSSFTMKYKPLKSVVACRDRMEKHGDIIYLPLAFISALC